MKTRVLWLAYLHEPTDRQIITDMEEHGWTGATLVQGPEGFAIREAGQPVANNETVIKRLAHRPTIFPMPRPFADPNQASLF
jgi:hypothetical protein